MCSEGLDLAPDLEESGALLSCSLTELHHLSAGLNFGLISEIYILRINWGLYIYYIIKVIFKLINKVL